MSDIKFACSQCGQNITADGAWAGRQIQCPHCQASLNVPAPAPINPPPLPPVVPGAARSANPPPPGSMPQSPRKGVPPWVWILLVVGVLGVVAIGVVAIVAYQVYRSKERAAVTVRQAPPSPRVTANNSAPKIKDPPVTTDPVSAEIPGTPASGTIRGQPFTVEAANVNRVTFELRQGKDFFPDASLKFFLFLKAGEQVDGRKFIISPADTRGMKPHIHVARREGPNRAPKTEIATSNYALRLEFGERQGDKIPGRIFLEMGERHGTKVAGTFEATVKE